MSPSPRPRAPIRRSLRGIAHLRLRVFMIAIAMIVSLFAARLVQLQGVDSKELAAKAAALGLVEAELPAKRGEITDRNGEPLAQSVPGSMVVADPKQTAPHAAPIARILADRLGVDYFDVLQQLQKPKSRYAIIARRVPTATATAAVGAVEKLHYAGLDIRDDLMRAYPDNSLVANLLGFLQADGTPVGGLEKTLNPTLAGKNGRETYEVGSGNRIPLGDNSEVKPVNGKPVRLTIDRDVQYYAQKLVENKVHQSKSDSGTAIVMDTQTGELLALADYPSYDPNHVDGLDNMGSRGVTMQYEPGSVEKVLTTSALMDAGKVTPRTQIVVPPELPVQGGVIHDYFTHPTLHLTMAGAIALSSNIATARAASTMSHAQLYSYLRKFGLGQRTDIGLPSETAGTLRPPGTWTQLTQANMAFGQGVAVNAVQMAAAVNTVANGGEYVSPSLVEGKATTQDGTTVGTDVTKRHRVVSAATARKEARMMEMVTTQGAGTAPGAKVVGYRTAGKTGTAQEIDPACGCYRKLTVSFAGFAPADKPRFTVYVVFQNSKINNTGGGLVAGPVFRRLMTYVLAKYGVPPTDTPPAKLPIEW